MGIINDLLIAESESYISELMAGKLPEKIICHTFDHALQVKRNAEKIGEHAGLSKDEMNILRVAALFLNAGYVTSYENCTEESKKIASAYLAERGADQAAIVRVAEIIEATKLPQNPKDRVAEVLCDANMMYIASDNGVEQFDLLYEELVMAKGKNVKRQVYEKGCIDFFTTHTYFTEFGKTILQPRKEEVVRRLSERLARRKMVEEKKESAEKNSISYSRGVDTLFRITARNQINLNSIADNKSNILISVNAIIISIIITMLAGNIGNMSKDILPILVFLVICLVTIIIAILSTRPNIVTSKFSKQDLDEKNVDLIFFGNFVKLDYDEYLRSVREMMKDEEHVYSTLIKNQYSLGKILSKKFRLVRIAYNVFMVGIIITVIVFLLNYAFIHRFE